MIAWLAINTTSLITLLYSKKRRGPNRRIISVKMASKKDMRRLDLGKTTSIEANVDHESAVSLISVLNRSHPLHRAAEG